MPLIFLIDANLVWRSIDEYCNAGEKKALFNPHNFPTLRL